MEDEGEEATSDHHQSLLGIKALKYVNSVFTQQTSSLAQR